MYLEKTLGSIVAEDYRAARIFDHYQLDYCCGGKTALIAACAEKTIDPEALIQELKQLRQNANGAPAFRDWSIKNLIDYILVHHHQYIRMNMPSIVTHAEKVASRHGQHHPEMMEVAIKVAALQDELLPHLVKEEKVLFPWLEQKESNSQHPDFSPDSIPDLTRPIEVMEHEHEHAGELIHAIRRLTGNYAIPEDACTTYRILLQELEEFDARLIEHIHLENNLLFPYGSDYLLNP